MNYGNGDNYAGMWANGERFLKQFIVGMEREFTPTIMVTDMKVIS